MRRTIFCRRANILVPALLAFSGCAASPGAAPQAEAGSPRTVEAEQVAIALAEADAAYAAGDRARLTQALRVIRASGAAPAEGESWDPVPAWNRLAADQAVPTRGTALGPGYRSGKLEAGKSASIEQIFLSGEQARIVLSAPGKAPLNLRVRNAKKQDVCDQSGTPNHCQWVPLFTERYSIVISNPGDIPARYYLVVK